MKARLSLALAALLSASMQAAEPTPQQAELFEKKVRPLLSEKCFKCHSHDGGKIKGGLVLDSLSGALQGGESGKPAVVPGKPDQGGLMSRVRSSDSDEQMPPKGERLNKDQLAILEEWIKQGAPWPGGNEGLTKRAKGKITDEDRKWWAFQPLGKVSMPTVKDNGWARNEVDRFIFSKLSGSDLAPSPEASRQVLIRRVYFDLWGLPPSAEEIDAFVGDKRPDAYERLVDRLLASPKYGERWARHWLDLVRYADSDGYKSDDFRPAAWMYRDYVIRSLNADKPYDRFVREQLAGDEVYPDEPDARIATSYMRNGIYEYNNRDAVGQWSTILNDVTDTTADVFLGLGVQCARCHDHKFDPILQKDYYRLQAFFSGIIPREDVPAATAKQRADYAAKLATWEEKAKPILDQIEELEGPVRRNTAHNAINKFPPDLQAMIRKPLAERSTREHQIAELAYRQVQLELDKIATKLKPADKETVAALRKKLNGLNEFKPAPLPLPLTMVDVGPVAGLVTIPKKGDAPVEPGFPSVFGEEPATIRPLATATNSSGRRAALADWLARPDNPLSSRVMVNRVWQYHFGKGLVATSSDFGRLGEKPSHPELLDWLAQRFVADGWSLKKLHKLMVTSAAYRQASSPNGLPEKPAAVMAANWKKAALADPENRLLWRGQTRRLDAEQIRDALLSATGELKTEAVGPAADTSQFRRSIYTKVLRNTRDPLLDVFDVPQHFSSTASRDTTTTPVQSLMLINSPFMLQRSKAMARRLEKESAADEGKSLNRAFLLAYGRRPTAEEAKSSAAFLAEQRRVVSPEMVVSASAGFLTEKIPFRDGRAALFAPKSPQEFLEAPLKDGMAPGDFTIEAFVYLRSVQEDATVRTIAASWSGKNTEPGWALGVTGKKSAQKPQTVVLQLAGKNASGTAAYEAVFSEVQVQLDRPYFIAASVHLGDAANPHVHFTVKDMANDDEPIVATDVKTSITSGIASKEPLSLGGRPGAAHLWDGMIDDVRLSRAALSQTELLLTGDAVTDRTVGLWQFEAKPSYFRDASSHGNDIKPARQPADALTDPKTLALADLCHALLNSSEFLYVE